MGVKSVLLAVRRANAVEKTDQRGEIGGCKSGNGLRIPSVHRFVQLRQKFQTFFRYSTEDPAPILGAGSTCHQSLAFEPVDEAGNSGSLFYHPLSDRQCR